MYLGLFWSVLGLFGRAGTKQTEQTRAMVMYLYEPSTCRYVRLNALNMDPFQRPLIKRKKIVKWGLYIEVYLKYFLLHLS